MDVLKKSAQEIQQNIYTSFPRKINELEYDNISSVTWVRETNTDIQEYLNHVDFSDFPKIVSTNNALDDRELELFFKEFPIDKDELRKGHEKIIEDIKYLLKTITALNPKRNLSIKILTNFQDKNNQFSYSDEEINLICSYAGNSIEWLESKDYHLENEEVYVHDNFQAKEVEECSVIVFKGASYPSTDKHHFAYRFNSDCKFALVVSSYMAEH